MQIETCKLQDRPNENGDALPLRGCHGHCSEWPCSYSHFIPTPSRGHATPPRLSRLLILAVVFASAVATRVSFAQDPLTEHPADAPTGKSAPNQKLLERTPFDEVVLSK